jgi:hypothetical protein
MAKTISPAEVRRGSGSSSDVLLTINDVAVDPSNIIYLVVREWMYDDIRTPRIELVISDDGMFTDVNVPFRGKTIHLTMSRDKTQEAKEPGTFIDTDFTILDFQFVKSLGSAIGNNSLITISGMLKIDNWFSIVPDKAFVGKKSNDVLKAVCDEIGVVLNDSAQTTDVMNWLRINQTPGQFIQHIVTRANATTANDSVLFWIDINKTAYYTTISKMKTEAVIHETKYNVRYASATNIKDLVKEAKGDGVSEPDAKTTVWYTSLDFRNNQGTNVSIKGGTTFEDKLNFNTGTFYFGKGSDAGNQPPLSLTELPEYNQFANLLEVELNPDIDFPGVNNSLFSGSILTGQLDNVWGEGYISNPYKRSGSLSALYNNSVVVEVNPNIPTMIGDKVNIEVNSNVPNKDKSYKNSSLSGEYLITGCTYSKVEGFFKKFITCNRTGFNKQDVGEE